MSEKNYSLELYKIIKEGGSYGNPYVSEFGWISSGEFCVWVDYYCLNDFMEKLKEIFGYGMFDDGGFDANMQIDGVCIVLNDVLNGYVDIEEVFPKDKYRH